MLSLQDICLLITDGKHGDCQNEADSGYYFVSCKDVRDGWIDYTGARQITKEDYLDTHRRTKLRAADIVITNSGTIGRMALVKNLPETKRTTFQKSVAIVKPDQEKVLPRWLYYSLMANRSALISWAGGTAQKNLLLRDMRAFQIDVASLSDQHRISAILSAYDDLIENNLRRVKILEEMAQNLYREWFVKFRFPDHEQVRMVDSPLGKIPEGWELGRLDDLVVLQRGFDLPKKKRQPGRTIVYAAAGPHGFHNEAKVKGPGVVTGRSGTIGVVTYVEKDFWPLNTTLWVKKFKRCTPLFAFYLLSGLDFEQFRSGAAVPTLNRNHVHGLPVVLPPEELIRDFQSIANPMNRLVNSLREKNETLRQTRDLLLPKLISGELDVSELDIATSKEAA